MRQIKLKVLEHTRRDGNNVCWIAKDNKTSTPVCRCFGTNTKLGYKKTEAMTRDIVKGYNNHDDLLEACEMILMHIPSNHIAVETLKQAIAKAKEQARK